MAGRRPNRTTLVATCVCVALGCVAGYVVWQLTVWHYYYSKSSPKPLPFESFGEVTRILAISMGGIVGLVGKEVVFRCMSKPAATKRDMAESE